MKPQVVYVAYFDVETNLFELRRYDTKELIGIFNLIQFKDFVKFKERKRVFINDLNIIAALIPGGSIDGVKSMNEVSKEYIRYTISNCVLESISVKCPSDWGPKTLKDIYCCESITSAMIELIEFMGGPVKISRTFASHSKKEFFRDIKDILWEDKKERKAYINTVEEFNILHAGCKKGFLSKPNKLKRQENVTEWDIKSAYLSAFVYDNKFPVGKQRISKNKSLFFEEISKGNNVKFVCNEKIPEIEEKVSCYGISYWDDFNKMTALEFYDIIDVTKLGVNFTEIFNKYDCTFVTYDETNYTNYTFAEKCVKVFEEKNRLPKSDPQRPWVKGQTEVIYGKSIQKRIFKSDKEVVQYYKGRGDNYLTPQMGNHASSFVRHQIFQIVFDLGDDVLYYDTDGVKVRENERTREYFRKRNEIIKKKLEAAGFKDTNLGTWEDENFDEFLPVRAKIYITRKGENIKYTAAGLDEYAVQQADDIYRKLTNGCGGTNKIITLIEKMGLLFMPKQIILNEEKNGVVVCYPFRVLLSDNNKTKRLDDLPDFLQKFFIV